MDPVFRLRILGGRHRDRMAAGYRWATGRNVLAARLALLSLVALIVIVAIPIALLIGAGALVVVVILGILGLVDRAIGRVRNPLGRSDGRSNVRVSRRE